MATGNRRCNMAYKTLRFSAGAVWPQRNGNLFPGGLGLSPLAVIGLHRSGCREGESSSEPTVLPAQH
jgi:hypothetical protein